MVRAALAATLFALATFSLTGAVPAQAATARQSAAVRAAIRTRLAAWHWALHQRGKPYLWGGTGPRGFDCSGLVYMAYLKEGIRLPRTTYGMLDSWHLVRIPKREARRGDLAFFGPGHVELFAHGDWTFGAEDAGTRIGFHEMSVYWHPTMYFRVRR